jgi:Secretion system C-terminal sorting domain
LPNQFDLFQNYPNPFNPSTIINYEIPKYSFVTLKVFDILGREIAILVNEAKPAGKYSITFDATNLSSGIYFYRITAGNFSSVKKMLLIK